MYKKSKNSRSLDSHALFLADTTLSLACNTPLERDPVRLAPPPIVIETPPPLTNVADPHCRSPQKKIRTKDPFEEHPGR